MINISEVDLFMFFVHGYVHRKFPRLTVLDKISVKIFIFVSGMNRGFLLGNLRLSTTVE